MRLHRNKYESIVLFFMILAAFILQSPSAIAGDTPDASFLLKLSTFSGVIPYAMPKIYVDGPRNEVYVISTTDSSVGIYNQSGMETYRFTNDSFNYDSGSSPEYFSDATVDADGNIVLLIYTLNPNNQMSYGVELCNYRGDKIKKIEIKGLPEKFLKIFPTRLKYRDGLFYLADQNTMRLIVIDEEGVYKDGYELPLLMGLDKKDNKGRDKMGDVGMVDFSIDKDGSILFTSPVLGLAYSVSPDRQVTSFGRRGSAPGRFGVPSAIVADAKGNYYVADTLRCVVIVFDKDKNFVTEFGGRGYLPGNFIGPKMLAIDNKDRVYISQLANRGVSVYQLT